MRQHLFLFLLLIAGILPAQPYAVLTWTVANGLSANDVTALAQDRTGLLWIGTNGGGLACFDGKTFRTYTRAEGLADNFVVALRTDEDGSVYVLTKTGTAVLAANATTFSGAAAGAVKVEKAVEAPQPFLAPSQLPGTRVRAQLTDRQQRVWLGTDAGLVRLLPTGLRHFTAVGHQVTALCPAPGRLWIGLGRNGVQYYDSTGFHPLAIDDPTRGHELMAITRDAAGRTYFATTERGITLLDDTLHLRQPSLATDRLLALLPADSGRVWAVSYDQGISRLDPRDSVVSVAHFGVDQGVPLTNFTAALAIADQQQLLLADGLGNLYRWQADSLLAVYGRDNGLPAAPIAALALRRSTQLWVAVTGHGLFYTDLRLRPLRFAPLPNRLGDFPTNFRTILAPDDARELWLGTDRHLVRLYLDANERPDWFRTYERAEGFPVAETLAAAVDYDGLLWFGTTAGLVSLTPDKADGYLAPPPTFLTDISLFYEPLMAADYRLRNGIPQFTAEQHHFNFRFLAVDLTHPERVAYSWRLRGLEPAWSPVGTETSVRYAGLSAGRYVFEVRATTDGGKTWGEMATYTFNIAGPWWQQSLFLAAVTFLGITLLVGGFYAFYRRVQRVEAEKRAELEAQNQLLTLEQKALQLQMNPHFIFNALNGIRGLIDGQHDREARQQINRFARLMRGILNNSRRATIPLNEEIATLTDYLEMEYFCQPFDFTYDIVLPADIDPEEVSLPAMLLQPFLENAVLHGLSNLERPGRISVRFMMRGRRMQCTVEDNGVGRAVAGERKARTPLAHQSVALEVTRERLRAMGGRLEIEDLTDENGKASGTRVTLLFPVDSW